MGNFQKIEGTRPPIPLKSAPVIVNSNNCDTTEDRFSFPTLSHWSMTIYYVDILVIDYEN
jgi:hypothetical protein